MKVLITGSSTVGKTTLAAALQARGFTTIDGDNEPGLVRIELKATGEPVQWPQGYVDWSVYGWRLQAAVLKQVLTRAETVFIAGIFDNQADFYDLFDQVLVLTLDAAEYKRRLDNRPRRSFGDSDENMLSGCANTLYCCNVSLIREPRRSMPRVLRTKQLMRS